LSARGPLLAALVLAAAPLLAGSARLEVDLAPRTATVGEPILVTLTLRLDGSPAGAGPNFPEWTESWGDATVLEASPVARREEGGETLFVQKLRLAAFRPGRIALPLRQVRLDGPPATTLSTPADLALEIRSVLSGDATKLAPKPPDPPRPLPVPHAFAWTATALAALAIGAAILLWRRPGAAARTRAATALPPLAELELALATLDGQPPVAAQAALSLGLRRYLGRSFEFPAVESTTSELARRLDRRGLERDLVKRCVRLLREADGVKFARQPTDAAAVARGRDEARTLALGVEQHLHPPVAGESA
jgi:hypothetical protein